MSQILEKSEVTLYSMPSLPSLGEGSTPWSSSSVHLRGDELEQQPARNARVTLARMHAKETLLEGAVCTCARGEDAHIS